MDFSKIKELTIPEGKVKTLSIGGVNVWKKNGNQYIIPAGTYVYKESGETVIIETAQIVSKEYHEWFSANVENFEYIILQGVYTFSDELNIENLSINQSIKFSCTYTNDSTVANTFMIFGISNNQIIYGKTTTDYIIAYRENSIDGVNWEYEGCEAIELKNDASVNRNFYYWFMENATMEILN